MDDKFFEMRVAEQLHEPLDAREVPIGRLVGARLAFEIGQGEEAGDGGGVGGHGGGDSSGFGNTG